MKYTKKFSCFDELKVFVDFHRQETGLLFSCDRERKTAWIEVDEKVCRELEHADIFDPD